MRFLLVALLLLAGGANAQDGRAVGPFPQIAVELDLDTFGYGTPSASDKKREGFAAFLFGHLNAGLYLSPSFSIQGTLHTDPATEAEPNGANTFLRRQSVFLEQLYLDWRPTPRIGLFGGKFNAPFGYGYEAFPGVLPAFRAHEVYLIREQLGVGASAVVVSDALFGEHELTAAVFTRDTGSLSNTLFSRGKCCDPGFERYRRNSLTEGGPGNNGRLDNFAIALDGDRFGLIPNFTYHAAVLSRAPGKDGTRREWGLALGARYEAKWTPQVSTLFFGEWVRFRNSGGTPLGETAGFIDENGEEFPGDTVRINERRQFTTLGAQTRYGAWRATVAWQRDQIKNSLEPTPTQNFLEFSVGRQIGWGFGLDIGYQYARFGREEASLGQSNSVVGRLNFRQSF